MSERSFGDRSDSDHHLSSRMPGRDVVERCRGLRQRIALIDRGTKLAGLGQSLQLKQIRAVGLRQEAPQVVADEA